MLTSEQETYILEHAYVPEHCIQLMTLVSGGEPFLIDDFFICRKDSWIILIGYPLADNFSTAKFEAVFSKVKNNFRPDHISLVVPEMSPSLSSGCRESESDFYFTLRTQQARIQGTVRRNIKKARQNLRVESSSSMENDHQELMAEFIQRVQPSGRVKRLLAKMPQFVVHADGAFVLNARDKTGKLAAFYVVDFEARQFSNYIIGCHSRVNYFPGASDLLLFELIRLSLEKEKPYIHLGLGVNTGIRRFKTKWGGVPERRYEMCELAFRKPSFLNAILTWGSHGTEKN